MRLAKETSTLVQSQMLVKVLLTLLGKAEGTSHFFYAKGESTERRSSRHPRFSPQNKYLRSAN